MDGIIKIIAIQSVINLSHVGRVTINAFGKCTRFIVSTLKSLALEKSLQTLAFL